MPQDLLKHLIHHFSPEEFIHFFRLKNRSFRPYTEPASEYNDEQFTDALFLGEIPFNATDRLVIYSFKVNRDLTERTGKKAQYEKGKRILKETQADAGIFIFYDSSGNFRFSLITVTYTGTGRKFSSFKRYTYLVSPKETNKTFLQQISSADFSSIEKIKEAFSVEKVTKEFFQEIANWYLWALRQVKFPPDAEAEPNGRNIALIRLITRIIFIWFMKVKGIVPDHLFDRSKLESEILSDLSPDLSTYYRAILQNLFFATLNTPVDQRRFRREERYKGYLNKDYMKHNYFRYHSLFKDPEGMKGLFNDIPFLNGGLFECLDRRKDDESNDTGREIRIDGFSDDPKKQPYIPNLLFFSEEKTIDLSAEYGEARYRNAKVRGLIDILKSYNFTIDENTPVDEEVALDPELLGKVFENLLASYNPETATTARKATGSYYTPREIVDYMVEESLKEYLKSQIPDLKSDVLDRLFSYEDDENPFDEKTTHSLISAINSLRIIDPAVGSGAFPMGALHALVHILHKLDPHNERWKERQIKAVEDVTDPRLRQELIDKIEESFSSNELDYGRKLYLIQNCIYGVDIQPIAIQIAKLRFFISLLVDEKVDRTRPNHGIEPLPNLETKFVAANTLIGLPRPQQLSIQTPDVERLEKELKGLREQYFVSSRMIEKERLKRKDSELRNALASELAKSGWGGETTEKIAQWNPYNTNISASWFDPEWMFGVRDGFDIVIANPPYISHDRINNKQEIKKRYCSYEPFADIYCYFIEKAMKLQNRKGLLCFITSNSYLKSQYGYPLRKLIRERNNIIQIINIEDFQIFDSAIVNSIILLSQSKDTNKEPTCLVVNAIFCGNIDFKKFVDDNKFYYSQNEFLSRAWTLVHTDKLKIKKKIESAGKTLEGYSTKIRLGLATGANYAFIIDEQQKQRFLKKNPKNIEIIKSILRGRDIFRYAYKRPNLYILLAKNEIDVKKDYPDIYEYLDSFGEKFKKRGAKGKHWSNLRACSFFDDFKKEKIIWIELTDKGRFALYSDEIYLLNTAYFLIPPDIFSSKYLLGILNSTIIEFYLHMIAETSGMGTVRWINIYVKQFPIPEISFEEQEPIINTVDKILSITQNHDYLQNPEKQEKVKELEREIDRMVYKLYELTSEEIEVVEGGRQ